MNLIEQVKAGKPMLFRGEPCTAFILPESVVYSGRDYPIGVLHGEPTIERGLCSVSRDGYVLVPSGDRTPDLVPAAAIKHGTVWVFLVNGEPMSTMSDAAFRIWSRHDHPLIHTHQFTYEA